MNISRLSVLPCAYIIASQRSTPCGVWICHIVTGQQRRTAAQEIVGWANLVVPIMLQRWESGEDGNFERCRIDLVDRQQEGQGRPSGTESGKAP